MDSKSLYSHCEEQVKRHDPGRYLCTLLFPDADREKLMPLFAFNLEIASIAGMVSDPMIGLIRLSWWKEGIEQIYAGGPVREHPVLQALSDLIAKSKLPDGWYQGLIAARERDIYKQPFDTLEDLYNYCEQTSSVLFGVAAQLLGASGHAHHEALSVISRAWAIAGLLRAAPLLAGEGRNILPLDVLAKYGVSADDALQGKNPAAIINVIAVLALMELDRARSKNIKKLLPPELKLFSTFHAHCVWWLKRIVAFKGNVSDPGVKSGTFWLLSRVWLASKGW